MTPTDRNKQMTRCLNCLGPEAIKFPIGHDQGSQRDPYRVELLLCDYCTNNLLTGDLGTFAERYTRDRTLHRLPSAFPAGESE